ncbi:MAG: Phosphoribosylamine--glycine ligase [Pseudomonadota bacterium]
MKVLIIGSGGREHALAWKCANSPRVTEVIVAPGNAGTATEARVRNVAIAADDLEGLARLAEREGVALTIVGPEVPLVLGITDLFASRGLACFGPSKAASQLEGSKAFTKEFLARHGIPTAGYRTFNRDNFDKAWLVAQRAPIVVKASGLAAGKGVIIAQTAAEAVEAAESMLFSGRFGDSGAEVVIEEFLDGEEASFIVMCDGKHVVPMATSQDHKRIGDGDTGPNTGGMGAYSPAPVVTPDVHARVMKTVIEPTVAGLAADGMPFVGFLYAGLMIAADGSPKVIEYNVRFGDPETQPILSRLRSDLTVLCEAALAGRLDTVQADWDPRAALGVVIAAGGYPDDVRKGDAISGLDTAAKLPGKVFHAGTALKDGQVVTSGGRVLCAVGLGDTVRAAQAQAYTLVDAIGFTGLQARRDIGYRAIAREERA